MKAGPVLVTVVFALGFVSSQAAQQRAKPLPPPERVKPLAPSERAKPLPAPEYAEARLQYCKGHEALGALGFLRHRAGRDADALPMVIRNDFHNMRGADLRMRIWTLNHGMNVATTEQDAKKGAFKHCVDNFAPVLEQMRRGPLR